MRWGRCSSAPCRAAADECQQHDDDRNLLHPSGGHGVSRPACCVPTGATVGCAVMQGKKKLFAGVKATCSTGFNPQNESL